VGREAPRCRAQGRPLRVAAGRVSNDGSHDIFRIVRPGVEPANTVEQLRADIDRGRTGDKIAGPDPAAAPLGADEEAAGTPLRPEAVAAARARSAHARCVHLVTRAAWARLGCFL